MGDASLHKTLPVLKTKQTAVLPFALTGLGDYICDRRYYVERQGMEECLLIYTVEGEGLIRCSGKEAVLKPGQVTILDCRSYHYYATHGESWHFLWFHFTGKCASDYVELWNADGRNELYLGSRFSFQSYYEKLSSYAVHLNLQGELEISAMLQRLLTDLIHLKRGETFSKKYGNYQQELEKSIAYLKEHFNENISVKLLADITHLSKYYYIRIFRAYTGQTPYDYLLNFRLQQSQRMLLETGKTVADIAQETGFADSKNFIACFKKRVGMTPLQYRKQNE